jgi:glycerol-3-phosphate acyltransferase PlsY
MLELGLKVLFAYLLGSIVGALAIGQLRGVDIRTMGSGNAGGTNALRTQGLGFAAVTIVIDVGKGWLAADWVPRLTLPGIAADPVFAHDWLAVSCAAAAVIGHVWPLWHEFRGGKGGATLAGALLALWPVLFVIALVVWLAFAMSFGFVGLATVAAAVSVPVALAIGGPASAHGLAFGIVVAALVTWAHRGNLARIRAGTEPRADRLWLFRPRRTPR